MSADKHTANEKTLWTPARLAGTFLVLMLVAAFGASSCNSTDDSATKTSAPPVTRNASAPAPRAPALATLPAIVRDAQLPAASGAPIKLSNYSGKVLVVNLWATWCGPCRSEIPELVKLYQEFRSRGLEVVGLSTEDPESSAEGVRRFVTQFGMNYRVGWATPEVSQTLMQDRNAIPQSFVISRDGRVLTRFVGFSAAETPLKLRKAVEEALEDKGKI